MLFPYDETAGFSHRCLADGFPINGKNFSVNNRYKRRKKDADV